jgi:2-haloacid dehalogenase
MKFDAVIFDLLTALIDSWTTWNRAAGSTEAGLPWRREYLRLTYGCGAYRPYEDLVGEAAANVGLPASVADRLAADWNSLAPWPEANAVLRGLADDGLRLAVATNCSIRLGRAAAARVGVAFDVVVTAEEAGWYKPRPEVYRMVLDRLGSDASRTLFVAGSPADVPGASAAGMPVFWHNRAGLLPIAGDARPLRAADTLRPLLEFDRW